MVIDGNTARETRLGPRAAMSREPIRIVIASDQTLDRRALASLLLAHRDFPFVREASSVREATFLCRQRPSDVLLLDTRLPFGGGESPVRAVRRALPETRIVAIARDCGQRCLNERESGETAVDPLACCDRPRCVGHALLDGACGLVLRSAAPRTLFHAVRSVARGRPALPLEFVRRAVACVASRGEEPELGLLSVRERQVATLIGEGLANKEIGDSLGIGVATVKKHVGHVLAKLHVQDRLQIALRVAHSWPRNEV